MSLQHSPAGPTDRKVCVACAKAIRALESAQAGIKPLDITKSDDGDFQQAKSLLWGIIDENGYMISGDTNRLTKKK